MNAIRPSRRLIRLLTGAMTAMLALVGLVSISTGASAAEAKTWDNFYKNQDDLILEFRYETEVDYTTANPFTLEIPMTVSGLSTDFEVLFYESAYADTTGDFSASVRIITLPSPVSGVYTFTFPTSTIPWAPPVGDTSLFVVIRPNTNGAVTSIGLEGNLNPDSWESRLKAIHAWSGVGLTSIRNAFRGTTIESVPGDLPPGVTDLSQLFIGRTAFNDPKVSLWNTSNVTDMSSMFYQATSFNQNLSGWDVSSVEVFATMFLGASTFNNGQAKGQSSAPLAWTLNTLTTASVDLGQMFLGASSFNQPLATWDTRRVSTMFEFLSNASDFNQDLSTFSFGRLLEQENDLGYSLKNSGMSCDNHEKFIRKAADDGYLVQKIGDTQTFETGYDLSGCERTWLNDYQFEDKMLIELEVQLTEDGDFSVTVPLAGSTSVDIKLFEAGRGFHQLMNPIYTASVTSPNPTVSIAAGNSDLPANGDRVFLEISGAATGLGGAKGDPVNPVSWSQQLKRIHSWGDLGLTRIDTALDGSSIEKLPGDLPTGVTSLGYLLDGQTTFNHPDIGFWDTSNVTNMSRVFRGASAFNQDISGWDVSSVTNLSYMFEGASSFNQPVDGWSPSAATTMEGMFKNASAFDQSIDYWFYFQQPVVTNMSLMFSGATSFNQSLNNWVTNTVENMQSMFAGASSFNQSIASWNTSNVTDMGAMFQDASAFNQDISGWVVSGVTDMSYMFNRATSFNQNLNSWVTSAATEMVSMFDGATSFNQPVGNWNVSQVTDFEKIFFGASSFNQASWSWEPGSATKLIDLFTGSGMQCGSGDAFLVQISQHVPTAQALNQIISGVFVTDPNQASVKGALEQLVTKDYFTGSIKACANAVVQIANFTVAGETNQAVSVIPANTGGNAFGMSISPVLPTGLIFDNTNGGVRGTLTSPYSGTHTVTASNQAGDSTFTITISITNPPPQSPPPSSNPIQLPTPAPVVQQASPNVEEPQQPIEAKPGSVVSLGGSNLENLDQVVIQGNQLSIVEKTATRISFRLPALADGNYDLELRFGGQTVKLEGIIAIVTTPEAPAEWVLAEQNRFSSWINRPAIESIRGWNPTEANEIVCIAYNDRPGLAARKKAVSRANHACRIASEKGIPTRIFVYGRAADLADQVKLITK